MFYLIFGSFGGALLFFIYQIWYWLKNASWKAMPLCKVLGSDCWLDSTGYRGIDIILAWFAHVHISFYLILLGMFLIGINKESK
jgi:hypothetical protein